MSHVAANPQLCPANDRGDGSRAAFMSGHPVTGTLEACERELAHYRTLEMRLRHALAESEERIRRQDRQIQQQLLLKSESDHRLLNDLQMTISLLSMQSRGAANPEAAAQLAVAANRVAMIARIHHRLIAHEGLRTIEFKKFLTEFARDFSAMIASADAPDRITVEGAEIELLAATAIPLGFIASELITNAAKYGGGRILVTVEHDPDHGFALSVANDGPALPEGYDPVASTGLGMKIIQAFVRQIDGELRFGRAEHGLGARFTVWFPAPGPGSVAMRDAGGRK